MTTTITPAEIKFYQDEVTAFQANDGEVYAAVNKVLRNIGFNEDRVKAIRKKWRDDRVISPNGRYFTLRYSGGVQPVDKDTYCITNKILPLALAKISITPELEKSYPEVVEKLVRYQLECADVLYNHFFKKETTPQSILETPLSREELSMFMYDFRSSLETFAAGFKDEVSSLAAIIKSQNDAYNKNMLQLTDALSKVRTFTLVNTAAEATGGTSRKVEKMSPDAAKWLRKAWESARIISKRNGKDETHSLMEGYAILRRNGIDLTSMYNKYKVGRTKPRMINMIAESDDLREKMEDAFKELRHKYYPSMYDDNDEKHIYKSTMLISTPPAVKELIQRIADARHLPYNAAAKDVYRTIEERSGKDLKEIANRVAEVMGHSNCCKAYAISLSDKYMDILRQIAEEG